MRVCSPTIHGKRACPRELLAVIKKGHGKSLEGLHAFARTQHTGLVDDNDNSDEPEGCTLTNDWADLDEVRSNEDESDEEEISLDCRGVSTAIAANVLKGMKWKHCIKEPAVPAVMSEQDVKSLPTISKASKEGHHAAARDGIAQLDKREFGRSATARMKMESALVVDDVEDNESLGLNPWSINEGVRNAMSGRETLLSCELL